MNKEEREQQLKKQEQYSAKIMGALSAIFEDDSDYYIDLEKLKEGDNITTFIHSLATLVPTYLYIKTTGKSIDMLEFNHIANRLIVQDFKNSNTTK